MRRAPTSPLESSCFGRHLLWVPRDCRRFHPPTKNQRGVAQVACKPVLLARATNKLGARSHGELIGRAAELARLWFAPSVECGELFTWGVERSDE